MKPQVKRLQSNINEHLCFLFITSNNKAKCIRPWTPILVFSQLNFQDFHHVFHRSLSTAWKPSVVLLPFHRRIPQAAPSISSPNTARILHPDHKRKEGLTLLSQTTRIELERFPPFLSYWGLLEFLEWNLSFLWYAWLSFWHMTSKSFSFAYKMRYKSVSSSAYYLQTDSELHQYNIWTD